ncbi:hypothetical protein BGX38DRAFT_1189428, partial [Terfezia claveryi]
MSLKTRHSTRLVFVNMYLAGTIIFSGVSVVIPILRSYGVGWRSVVGSGGGDFVCGH